MRFYLPRVLDGSYQNPASTTSTVTSDMMSPTRISHVILVLLTVSHVAKETRSQYCGGTIDSGSGVIRSPGFPDPYPPSSSCEWIIRTLDRFRVRLRFDDRDCLDSSLEIFDGPGSIGTHRIGEFCNTQPPSSLDSNGRFLTIKFTASQSQTNRTGFDISFLTIDDVVGSRVMWSEVNAATGLARINSLGTDPTELIQPDGTLIPSVSTAVYYRVPSGNWTSVNIDYGKHEVLWHAENLGIIATGTLGRTSNEARAYFAWTSRTVYGIATDWLTGNVYWTDAAYDWIMVCSADGAKMTSVIDEDLDLPTGIALHPSRGVMFWADAGSQPKMERSNLDGRSRSKLVTTDILRPYGITIDHETNLVYWVDADPSNNRVEVCDFNGNNRRRLFETNGDNRFHDVALFEDYIYVTGKAQNSLYIMNKNTGNNLITINLESTPYGVAIYDPDVQPPQYSPCSSNPCDFICFGGGPNGSYSCRCENEGLESGDGHTCNEGTIDPPQFFVASQTQLCRYPVNFPSMRIGHDTNFNVSCFLSGQQHVVAMAVDMQDGLLFFSDVGSKGLAKGTLRQGAPVRVITGGIQSVEGVAVDWSTKLLYWTDNPRGTIEVSKYDGSYRTTLLQDNVTQPRSIAIDPERKLMFWTEFGPPAQIERAGLDGSDRVVLLSSLIGLPLFRPGGLAIDYDEQRLYYGDLLMSTISSMDYDGNNRRQILRKPGAIFFDIALYKDFVLWTELGRGNGIYAANRETGETVQNYLKRDEAVFGITTYAESRQKEISHPCIHESNGRCDQLCLNSPLKENKKKGFVCKCSLGYHLDVDGESCLSDIADMAEDNFFLITDSYRRAIFQVDMSDPTFEPEALRLTSLQNPIAVTFDPVDRLVYWTDVAANTISRGSLDGQRQEVILSAEVQHPDGIAVDSSSRLLYWTDFELQTLSVSRLDGSDHKTLIRGLGKPRALVLHPAKGTMFWTDWGSNPSIERAYMDGSSRRVIVSGGLRWPNGLAIDYQAERLFWVDAGFDKIETADFNGRGRRQLVDFGRDVHGFGVVVVGDFIYWADWREQSILRAEKATGRNNRTIGPSDYIRPNGLFAVTNKPENGSTNCMVGNGGCSSTSLCLPSGILDNDCVCADGFHRGPDGGCQLDALMIVCPRVFPSGRVTEECDVRPGSVCDIECEHNKMATVDVVRCLGSGAWNVSVDSLCKEPECEALDKPDHATAGPCSPPFNAGKTCTHKCEPGYRRRSGSRKRRCEPATGWSGTQLTCEEVAQVQEQGGSCNNDMEFLERPVSQQSFEKDLIQLECVVSDPNAEIAWYKVDRRLQSDSVGGIFIQSANDLLIIPEFDLTHEGQYACVALVNGRECLRADLSITHNSLGYFAEVPEDGFAEEGEQHLFECSPEDPTYDVTWFKGDERIPFGGADVIQVPGGGLILLNLEPKDEGKYTCVLTDVGGTVKARAHAWLFLAAPPILDIPNLCGTITVQNNPATVTTRQTVTEGDPESSLSSNAYEWSIGSIQSDWENVNGNMNPKIIGGGPVEEGTAPYMVRLYSTTDRKTFCGGTLLDQQWVLTAAHCTVRYREDQIVLYFGDHDTHSRSSHEFTRDIAQIIKHPRYKKKSLTNDIALIRLRQPLRDFTDYVRPICLLPSGFSRRLLSRASVGRVTGWGSQVAGGAPSTELREVNVPVVSRAQCQVRGKKRMFCAGTSDEDSCEGDSGGPFAVKYRGLWYQLGIVTGGTSEQCAVQGEYGYYTSIAPYRDWLQSYNVTLAAPQFLQDLYAGSTSNTNVELTFIRTSGNVTIAEGSPLDLECVPNRDDASVEWYVGDVRVNLAHEVEQGARIDATGLILRIAEVRQDYTNTYTCEARVGEDDEEQVISARMYLTVTRTPGS
ncbi:uncharacterized protein [Diadema setosum]|uniref:uncharacterized protein n=1 Tax=Diadema setosum TaxID=31175 RepID=UPI003B3A88A3